MRFFASSPLAAVALTLLTFFNAANAINFIQSKSLASCQTSSEFTASLFDVVWTPGNDSLSVDINGVSSIEGNVTALLEVIAYGYTIVRETLNPCEMGIDGLCPMSEGQINLQTNIDVDKSVADQIPSIAYSVPDLDGKVRIYINQTSTGESVACLQADLSNGKTVYQKSVGWVTAVIAGLGLAASAITSGLGHSNTAAHVAANALSLFGFFQAQAFIGMTSVEMPPIVEAWTQDFQWSMGVIKVGFLESICTWYQRATGGTPSTLLSSLSTTSVQVEKRSVPQVLSSAVNTATGLLRRATSTSSDKTVIVKGIVRVGFRAGIESTNIFLTGMIFFLIFGIFVAIFVGLFKLICELSVKQGWMNSDKFSDFRNGWKIVLKGILFRLVLIGFPQMSVLCLWELVERDSAAEVILAIVIWLSMAAALAWASWKVVRLAKRSVAMHKNPAYMLYSDPTCLNKWGFLYVQFRATAYYYIVPLLAYILIKSIFIAFAQGADVVQAVALLVIEGAFLIAVSVLRPWMDKKTNVFNISIAAINFLNAIFLLFFTSVFGQPAIVTGVMGVVFFVYNAVFALVLLLLVLIASVYAIVSKDPDLRYQPMRDDRGSFIKSQNSLHTTELDALGATARGDTKEGYKSRFDDDNDSFSSDSQREAAGATVGGTTAAAAVPNKETGASGAASYSSSGYPVAQPASRHGPPPSYDQRGMYSQPNPSSVTTFNSGGYNPVPDRSHTASPQPYGSNPTYNQSAGYDPSPYNSRSGTMQSNKYSSQNTAYQGYQPQSTGYQQQNTAYQQRAPQQGQMQQQQFRQQNSASPWQRGAGYD